MRFMLGASCLGLILGALWATRPGADSLPYPAAAAVQRHATVPERAIAVRQWMAELPESGKEPATVPAWSSMAQARQHGDERMPPLQPSSVPDIAPSAAQLADPAAYRKYEQGQHARVLDAFAMAAAAELPKLRADVERARAAGIARGEILKVEAKIQRLERMRRGIVEDGVVPPG